MATNSGRVEIKFITDTKELENARKAINDLGSNLNKALDASLDSSASKAFSDMGKEADNTSKKVDDVTTSVDKLESEVGQLSNANKGFGDMGKEAETTAVKVDGVTASVDELGSNSDLGGLPDEIENIGNKAEKSTGGVKNLVSALGLLKVAGVAIGMITSSIDDAIGRVDTMRQFPKMMQQVGFTAEETEQSIDRLSQGIQGLPTRLNDVVATTQQIALTTGDLNKATEITLALNNAFLASGSAGADASRGLQQFSQMLSSGVVDMQSWRTLLETMPLALQTVAENFGYTGAAAKNDLYTALKEGVITFDDFTNAIIEANNAQGGFAELALTGSEGIATSFQNIRTSVVNGVSKVIEALDELVEELTGKNIAQNFDQLKNVIGSTFTNISSGIRSSTPYIRTAIALFQRLSPVIIGVSTAYAGLRIIQSIGGWMSTANTAIKGAEVAKKGLTLATKAMTAEEVASKGALTASQTAYAVLTGQVSALTLAKQGLTAVTSALTSPLGLVTTALALVAGGAVFAYQKINEVTAETQEYIDELAGISEENQTLIESTQNSAKAFDDSITSIDNNRTALKDLADEIVELAGKENKSAQDKAMLKGKIDTLNSSVEGLNLTYNEEADALNMSTEAIYARIDAMTDIAKAEAAQERLKQIFKEQLDIQAQINKNMQEIQTSGQAGNEVIQTPGFQQLIEDTNNLKQTYNDLTVEAQNTEMILANSMNNMATVTEESTQRQIIAFEQLTAEQQNVITELQDYYTGLKDHTQNMFDEINDTIMTTTDAGDEVAKSSEQIFAEMQATLEHNQQVVATWADNMANLAQRGVDEGLLNELSRLGPEGAPYVQALVDASDEELATLSETFAKGGQEALEALQDSLGLEDFEIEGLEGIITKAEESLTEQIESSGLNELGATIVEKIGDGIAEAEISGIQESFGTIIEQVPEWLDEGTEIVKQAGSDIVENVSSGVSEAGTESISSAVQTNVVDPVPQKITESAETFTSAGSSIIENIATGMQDTEAITNAVESSVGELPTKVEEKVPEMSSAGSNLMTGAQQGVDETKGNFIESVGTSATEALDSFKSNSGVQSPSTLYAQAAADIVAGAVQGINNNKATLSSATRTMATEAIQAFRTGSSGAYSAGAQLGAGFREGLASMRNSIINTATGIANAASAAINKALVVKSPSRKGMYSGSMLVQGVEVGMEERMGYLDKVAKKVADTAMPEMKPIDIQTALNMPRFASIDNSPIGATSKASNNRAMTDLLARMADRDIKVYLDDGTLVGKLAPEFDRFIGNIAKDKSRYG